MGLAAVAKRRNSKLLSLITGYVEARKVQSDKRCERESRYDSTDV